MNKSTALASIAGLASGLALMTTLAFCPPIAPTPTPTPAAAPAAQVKTTDYPAISLPACIDEDSDNCYWDAATMGNGKGDSFVTLHGKTYYDPNDFDVTVMPCSAWADTATPTIPPFTFTGACALPDGTLSTPTAQTNLDKWGTTDPTIEGTN